MSTEPANLSNMAKQVIVMRKFPSLRTGKYIAQACHASLGVFLNNAIVETTPDGRTRYIFETTDPYVKNWVSYKFTKIVTYVNSEQELIELQRKAQEVGLLNCLITDSGATEFHGQPTITALAIGPASSEEVDKVTKHLPLM